MPIQVKKTAGGANYGNPFFGPLNHTQHLRIDLSGLTTDEVDANGYLKPGVPFDKAGLLIATGVPVFGVVPEAIPLPLAVIPPTDDSLGDETGDCDVAVGVIGQVNRDVIEDNLGRALTAFEIAGFALADCRVILSQT